MADLLFATVNFEPCIDEKSNINFSSPVQMYTNPGISVGIAIGNGSIGIGKM